MTKKTPAKSNKKHTAEFKLEALKLADRVSATEAAEKLGIYPSQIYSWRTAINIKRTQGERESIIATETALLKRIIPGQAEMLKIF